MSTFTTLALLATTALAQVTIPATNGSLPAAVGNTGCAAGYYPGTSQVIYTVPYTYQQVLSIIGNYTNLTWSGSPDNSVTTNNSKALMTNNWGPGDARFYDIAGAHVIETILTYSKPANGPYVEVHTLAPLTVPAANVSFYSDFDGQVYQPICGGKATTGNYTINFCATNATVASQVLSMLHMTDAVTVGTFLGGKNFTSCAALGAGNATSTGSPNATSSMPAMYTGAAANFKAGVLGTAMVAAIAFALCL
ncbi:hypothetical protein LTR86_007875 [Recurvomyces mirabilis]|nr:hypothetical protein LTR86_007875 [Recurvomyces mirabilis]